MSNKENKEKKVQTRDASRPNIDDSPTDISSNTSQADLEKSSPSGTPCICKDKRNIMCTLHGG